MADESNNDNKNEGNGNFSSRFLDRLRDFTETSADRLSVARIVKAFTEEGMFKNFYVNPLDPKRLQAMSDAGKFLKEARELAGMSAHDLSVALGMKDDDVLRQVEKGESTLSFDMIFRVASLLARHDPLPFILKFMRTYSPALDNALEKFGLAVIPKQMERERRFLNIYRGYDKIRQMSDEEFERFYQYISSSTGFIVDVVETEKSIAARIAAEMAEAAETGSPEAAYDELSEGGEADEYDVDEYEMDDSEELYGEDSETMPDGVDESAVDETDEDWEQDETDCEQK